MDSVNYLTEVNIDQTEIPSKSNRDMEGTRNSKFKLVAFNFYLDLRGGVGWDGAVDRGHG